MLQSGRCGGLVEEDQKTTGSALSNAAETAFSILDGASLPAPVRRNALKAFDQLCAAAFDIPVAYLEGFAQAKRAENVARADIIRKSGEQIASGLEIDPAYARAAATKFAQKIARERVALDQISSIAAAELKGRSETDQSGEVQEISPDWINNFEGEASQKSSSEMQELFGRILAGEIAKPGTFSIRAVKILGQLDAPAAKLFQKLCSVTIAMRIQDRFLDARVPSLNGNAASNSLAKYGLSFDNLNTLQEYGLVISDFNSWMDYRPAIAQGGKVSLGFMYAGRVYGLVPKEARENLPELRIHGVSLTKAGRELMTVVPFVGNEAYTNDLMAFFDAKGFSVAPVQGVAT
jgi:hypothetical protein